jgi:hypothetical protein
MMLKFPAAMVLQLLLILVAVLAEADGQVLRLERHFPNASTDELVKLDDKL